MTARSDRTFSVATLAAALALAVSVAPATDAHLSVIRQGLESGGAMEVLDRHGEVLCVGDFNGDGFDDLATAARYEDYGNWPGSDHGAVIINFGSPEGLTHTGAQVIAPPVVEHAMLFGWAMTSADYEGDGFDDLVVGIPYSDQNGQTDSGALAIYRGGPLGFVNPPVVRNQSWISGAVEAGDRFGFALASGDIDADGYPDIAIGSPGENGGGAVTFAFGSSVGLTGTGSYGFTQNTIGTGSVAGESFGASIAIGNFTGVDPLPPLANPLDVAVGCPFEGLNLQTGAPATGMVAVFASTASGPQSSLVSIHTPSSLGLAGGGGRAFGLALAAGDFDQNGYDDLAIGRPGNSSYAGEVVELFGSASGVSFNSVRTANDHVANGSAPGDRFGYALATGDFDEDGFDDLLVGSPGHTQFFFTSMGRTYLYRSTNGFGLASWDNWDHTKLNVDYEAFDETGYAVAFGFFDDSGRANMVTSAPGAEGNAGRVHVWAPWRQPGILQCRNAVQFDCDGNFVYSLKPFDKVYTASTAKNMTILVACERAQLPPSHPDYVSLNAVYEVPAWVANNIGGSQFHLIEGELVTMRALMDMTMSVSGNDAAFALADLLTGSNATWNGLFGTVNAFVAEMNAKAAALGMGSTTFTNPAGFNQNTEESTSYDMAILGRAAIANPLFESVVNNPYWYIPRTIPTLGGGYYSFQQFTGGGFTAALQGWFPRAIGSKDGGSPAAGITGVFQARESHYPWGIAYGSVFNTPPQAQWVVPDSAALLQLGMDRCFNGPVVAAPLEPVQEPLVASATFDTHFTFVPPDPLAKEVELEIFNLIQDGLPVELRIDVARESTSAVGDLETAVWATEEVTGHDGMTIVYEGTSFANVLVQTNTVGNPTYTPTMGPGDVLEIPPGQLPPGEDTFVMTIFVSSADASFRVTERYGEAYEFAGDGTFESARIVFVQTSQVEVTASAYNVDILGKDEDPGHFVGLILDEIDGSNEFDLCPARWSNYGAGWPGTHGVPTISLDGAPELGDPITYRFGNSLLEDTIGFWAYGLAERNFQTELGGTLLVKPAIVFPLDIPAEGLEVPSFVTSDPIFCGFPFLHQLFVVDPGASHGVAFSRGLRAVVGE